MSAERRRAGRWWLNALIVACGLAGAEDGNAPEAAFIEYLGMWEASDEEWLMFEADENVAAASEERSDPAPEGEESTETDDAL